jgi:hypothetical protein
MIEAAIRDSGFILFVASPESLKSKEVAKELEYASSSNKPVIPIVIADCELPQTLTAYQLIDWRGDQDNVYSEHFSTLKEVVLRKPASME